jgi:hypothetical protein
MLLSFGAGEPSADRAGAPQRPRAGDATGARCHRRDARGEAFETQEERRSRRKDREENRDSRVLR